MAKHKRFPNFEANSDTINIAREGKNIFLQEFSLQRKEPKPINITQKVENSSYNKSTSNFKTITKFPLTNAPSLVIGDEQFN